VRYSGSPLAYSFSEADHVKGSWLVDLDAEGAVHAELVEAPVPRRLARLRGSLAELLADPALAVHEDSWVEATLTDATRPLQAMEKLRRRFPHCLVLGFATPPPGLAVLGLDRPAARATRSDRDIAADFLAVMRGTAPAAPELALLHEAVDACCADAEADTLSTAARPPAADEGVA
jgi:exonuclease SbcD